MKTLVVYFSQTKNTKNVAEKIAKQLSADLDEIVDKTGLGDKAVMKEVEIEFKKDPSKYDLVVIGSPVWAFGIPPFTKKYLEKNSFKKVAFFATFGLCTAFLFYKMKKLSQTPIATLKVHMSKSKKCDKKVDNFCEKLKN